MKNVWTESLQLALSPAEPLKPSEDAGRGAALMAHLFLSRSTLVRPLTKGCFTLLISVNVRRTVAHRGTQMN